MQLSQKAIKEFREIWKKQFKENITDEKANEKGIEFLRFFQLIYSPIPKEEFKKYQTYEKEKAKSNLQK